MNWTHELTLLACGLSLGALATYCAWCRFRVFLFRQDLYDIRNSLWDAAHAKKSFNDPAYMKARVRINALIAAADYISLPAVIYMYHSATPKEKNEAHIDVSESVLKEEIEDAYKAITNRIDRYITWERPFSAVFFAPVAIAITRSPRFAKVLTLSWTTSERTVHLSHQIREAARAV